MSFPQDKEARAFLVERLRDARRREGVLPTALVHHIAELLGKDERTVRRWCEKPKPRKRKRYQLTDRDRELYYQLHGNVLAVWRERTKEDTLAPSRATLQRAFAEQMSRAERAYAVQGEDGWRAHKLHLRSEPERRNAVWEADHKQLSIEVIPPNGTKPVKPWVTIFLDGHTRAVMGYAMNLTQTAADVIAAFRAGICEDAERGPFCGIPETLRWDNGREFLAESVTEVAVAVGCLPQPAPPFSPHLKGKIERFNRTLEQSLLSGLPGYVHGARKADGSLYGGDERISFEHFVELFEAFIRSYNLERAHKGLDGRTPEQAWRSDSSPIRTIPAEKLRWMLLPSAMRKVAKDGIHFARQMFVCAELTSLVGEEVEIRYMPHDTRSVDVYRNGEFVATAYPQAQLSASDRARLIAQRDRDRQKAAAQRRRATRKTKVRLAPTTNPAEAQVVTTIDAQELRREGMLRTDRDLSREASLEMLEITGLNQPLEQAREEDAS